MTVAPAVLGGQPAAIGNYIWVDEDSNGLQDEGEPGIPNVTVNLYDDTGTLVATTVTDSHGGYLFPYLQAGTYYVDVNETTLPSGMTQTTIYTNVTDADSGALLGIAVTAADTANGVWWCGQARDQQR